MSVVRLGVRAQQVGDMDPRPPDCNGCWAGRWFLLGNPVPRCPTGSSVAPGNLGAQHLEPLSHMWASGCAKTR